MFWPFKRRKVIGYTTHFQALAWYDKLLRGEITFEQFSNLESKDLEPIRQPIYEDDIKE